MKKNLSCLVALTFLLIFGVLCLAENITFGPSTRVQQESGWYIDKYYARVDTGWCDSTADSSRVIDTLETEWLHAGKNWESFWVYFDWTGEDTSLDGDRNDTLVSVKIEGCLEPDSFPTVLSEYGTVTSAQVGTLTVTYCHPVDSIKTDAPFAYLRAVLIYSQWMLQAECQGEGRDATYFRSDINEFEIYWKIIDKYK